MTVNDCVYDSLKFDEACLNLKRNDEGYSNLWFYLLSTDCVLCPFRRIAPITGESNISVKIETDRLMKWRVLNTESPDEYVSAKSTSNLICELSPNVGQYGIYELAINNNTCSLETLKQSTYPYAELFIIFGTLMLILLSLSGSRMLWQAFRKSCSKREIDEATANVTATNKRRVRSIDTFRGASTLIMIFLNNGTGYAVIGHATWNGLLFGDLVFPSFVWIMGVCIPIALASQMKRMTPKRVIIYSIVKRSILLFLIGVSLNTVSSGAQLEKIRIFGVLQRFGLTYLVVSLVYLFMTPSKPKKAQSPMLSEIRDFLILLPQWCLMIVIVIVHCFLTFTLVVPGCPTGYLGPGGRHEDGKYFNCTGGSTGYIDRILLTKNHLYQEPAIDHVYGSGPFDPEGILGCLTSIFQVFLGVQTGMILLLYKGWKERVIRWLLWAALFGCMGCTLHFTHVIPVNKNLWSLSFVLVTTSFALAALSGCYLLVDVLRVWRGGPFRVAGMNALLLYAGHILCYKIFPFHWRIGSMKARALFLSESIWGVVLWAIIAYIMHWKRTYITL